MQELYLLNGVNGKRYSVELASPGSEELDMAKAKEIVDSYSGVLEPEEYLSTLRKSIKYTVLCDGELHGFCYVNENDPVLKIPLVKSMVMNSTCDLQSKIVLMIFLINKYREIAVSMHSSKVLGVLSLISQYSARKMSQFGQNYCILDYGYIMSKPNMQYIKKMFKEL